MLILRVGLILVFTFFGYYIGSMFDMPAKGALGGVFLGLLCIVMEQLFRKVSLSSLVGGVAGLAVGLLTAHLLFIPFARLMPGELFFAPFVLSVLMGYGGLLVGFKKGDKLTIAGFSRLMRGQATGQNKKLLDTSVIIDGRIADVSETGFMEGDFIVPQFILLELQHIADSPDPLKRARGRRGLDVLHRMQKMAQIEVKISEEDFPKIKEVDSKLVAFAKAIGAKVITNDFNLNKVAELQGVPVLNINELANAIKPVVLPGEAIRVFIIKEGKEHSQGVAYLDDGTMVVVDNGRKLIGKNVDVTVTSVLQTTAGRMIFTKTREDYESEEQRAVK